MDALSGSTQRKENARLVAGSIEYIYKVLQRRCQRPRNAGYRFLLRVEEGRPCLRTLCSGQRQAAEVEVLANLDKVQPAGAVVIVSYPRIEGATGLPARVWPLPNKSGEWENVLEKAKADLEEKVWETMSLC